MKYLHYIVIFIGSIIVQYYLISPIIVSDVKNIKSTININKLYISIFQGLYALSLEIMLHDYQYNVISTNYYIMIILLFALLIYLYRNQIFIDDKQYFQSMTEHLSICILRSKEILKKTDNYEVSKVAKNMLQTQTDDIREMNEIAKKL